MSRFKLFVDTGCTGGAVAFRGATPKSFFRFKRDKLGLGVCLEPFLLYCLSIKCAEGVEVFIEDPAKVPRSISTTSTQYIVVGQIVTICELAFKRRPYMLSANQWINFVRRELARPDLKDPKDRSKLYAKKQYPDFVEKNFAKSLPDAITDCLGMAKYLEGEEEKTLKYI